MPLCPSSNLLLPDRYYTVVANAASRPTGAARLTGMMIYQVDVGLQYVWDGSNWVGGFSLYIVCTSSTRPVAPSSGILIYETDTGKVRLWTGAAWVVIAGRTGGSWRRFSFQNIPNTTVTAISWDTEDADTDEFLTPTSTTATIPAGLSGVYAVTAFGYAGADGEIHITASGTDIAFGRTNSRTGQATAATTKLLAAGTTITVGVWSNFGSAFNFTGSLNLWMVSP